MKHSQIEHVVVDEANQRTYVVRSDRLLTDGEIYRYIRLEILRQRGQRVARGETLTIETAQTSSRQTTSQLDEQMSTGQGTEQASPTEIDVCPATP